MTTKKPIKRKPAPKNTRRKVYGAVDLYKRFREEEPEFITTETLPAIDVGMVIGTLDTVEYTTSRGGKVEYYRHEFDEKSKPVLCSSWDGKQVFIVGGRYNFTEVGIKDY